MSEFIVVVGTPDIPLIDRTTNAGFEVRRNRANELTFVSRDYGACLASSVELTTGEIRIFSEAQIAHDEIRRACIYRPDDSHRHIGPVRPEMKAEVGFNDRSTA